MSLRLPGKNDPLTLAEIADLDRQLGKMLDENLPSYHLLRCQLENVSRLHATITFYHELFKGTRDLVSLDAALPKRVVRNGIAYLEEDRPQCTSFGADPDLKPGPLTPEDRGWKP